MTFKITGLKEAQNKLKKLSENANKLNGQLVQLTDVMTNEFIAEHSSFGSLTELIDSSEFKVESQDDFSAIPDEDWNEFIDKNTTFSNWKEMKNKAGAIYARKKLGLENNT